MGTNIEKVVHSWMTLKNRATKYNFPNGSLCIELGPLMRKIETKDISRLRNDHETDKNVNKASLGFEEQSYLFQGNVVDLHLKPMASGEKRQC